MTKKKDYQRRSGVVIYDTIADKSLLDVIDEKKETMRDLALLAAYIAKASPKFFGYIKTEMGIAEPSEETLIKTFCYVHGEIKQAAIKAAPPINNVKPEPVPMENNVPVPMENNSKHQQSQEQNNEKDIMPMLVKEQPTKRRGIRVRTKL